MADEGAAGDGLSRRRLLLALSGAGMRALAGCNELSTQSDPPATDRESRSPTTNPTATETATATETPTAEPADLRLEGVTVPRAVGQFQPATLSATLRNAGESPFDGRVRARLDDDLLALQGIVVEPGETVTIETEFTEGVVGPHDLTYQAERAADGAVAAETTQTVEVNRYPEHFVGVDGTEFTCGDGSLYLNGSNDQQVAATQIPESRIEEVFSIAADLGMNVMRVFGFAPSWSRQAAQPAPREYNETFFSRFDRIIAAAKRHDLRLVVPLVNNNRDVDSIARYVEWVDGASEHNDFYEMDACRALYKDYVSYVLTRENPLTGLEYREDPTIAMWELDNELNCRWPKKYPVDWIRDVGAHVKALDDIHPLGTGIEALQWGNDPNDKQSWRDGITEDTALIRSNDLDVVDVVGFHLYPGPHGDDIEDPDATFRDIIQASHEMLGKPTYIGEFNWGVRLEEGEALSARAERLSRWYDVFAEEDLGGTIVHEISTPAISQLKAGSRGTYNIVPEEDERAAEILQAHSEWVRSTATSSCSGASSR